MKTKIITLITGLLFFSLHSTLAQDNVNVTASQSAEQKAILQDFFYKAPIANIKNQLFKFDKKEALQERSNKPKIDSTMYTYLYQVDSLLKIDPYSYDCPTYIRGKVVNENYQALIVSQYLGYSYWSLYLLVYSMDFCLKDIMILASWGSDSFCTYDIEGHFENSSIYILTDITKYAEEDDSEERPYTTCYKEVRKNIIGSTGQIKRVCLQKIKLDCDTAL